MRILLIHCDVHTASSSCTTLTLRPIKLSSFFMLSLCPVLGTTHCTCRLSSPLAAPTPTTAAALPSTRSPPAPPRRPSEPLAPRRSPTAPSAEASLALSAPRAPSRRAAAAAG